jgi:pheromone alpha factor receptor
MGSIVGMGDSPEALNASLTDPETLPLIIPNPNGGNYTFRTGDLDALTNSGFETVIVFASQLGASLMLLIVMILLTKPDKRLTPIFALNAVSLLLNFLRLLLMCLYYTGPLNETYVSLTGDVSSVPYSAYGTQIGAVVMEILLVATVVASLALQVQVVCIDLRRLYRRLVFAASVCMALVAIGCRLAYGIANCQFIVTLQNPENLFVLEGATLNATSASIFFFSAVFVAKLGLALWKRHKLGLRRWGPMQILFTMGCQTLFIPGNGPAYLFKTILR